MGPKFICEGNLGKLAKWISYIGFDIVYERSSNVNRIAAIAASEDRTILTTRTDLTCYSNVKALKVSSRSYEMQLVEILGHFRIKKDDLSFFTRCFKCNQVTEQIDRLEYKEMIPPSSFEFGDNFRLCRSCNRIYWLGSHYKEVRRFMDILYLKFFSCCTHCGKGIPSEETKFRAKIDVKSTYDRLDLDDSETLEEINASVEEILQQIETMSSAELNDGVFFTEEFIICSRCQKVLLEMVRNFIRSGKDK